METKIFDKVEEGGCIPLAHSLAHPFKTADFLFSKKTPLNSGCSSQPPNCVSLFLDFLIPVWWLGIQRVS